MSPRATPASLMPVTGAGAIDGPAVITAVIVAFVVELAFGHDGSPYAWLGAIGGLAYLIAITVFRLRG